MPIVNINLVKGRDRDAVQNAIREVAVRLSRTLNAPLESIRIMVHEVEPDYFAVGTTLKSEAKAGP